MKDGICYIAGASGEGVIKIEKRPCDFVIAADAGIIAFIDAGITPDLAVGDFDSLGHLPDGVSVVRHPVEKDETDMQLAVAEGQSRGYRQFVIFGGLGGRLDHTLANIQLIAGMAESGCRVTLAGRDFSIAAIHNDTLEFDETYRGTVSVFAVTHEARGVYERGLKYSLNDAMLSERVPMGVSNEFTGMPSAVSVKDGTLIIMWETQD